MEKYRDIKYVKGGLDFDGCDCFGFISLFFKTEYKIDLPHYTDYQAISDVSKKVDYSDTHEGDISLFEHNGEQHTGIAINKYRFIHCLYGQGVITSRLQTWKRRLIGVYRLKGLKYDHTTHCAYRQWCADR